MGAMSKKKTEAYRNQRSFLANGALVQLELINLTNNDYGYLSVIYNNYS